MKVKKIFTTVLTTTLISQLLLPIMQVRAEETPYAEKGQTVEAKAKNDSVTSEAQIRIINKVEISDESDDYWIAKATESLDYPLKDGVSQGISEITFTEAEHFIEKIKKNAAKKAELSKTLAEGRRQYNYNKELEASVMNLFLMDTRLNSDVTQETIDSLNTKTLDVVNETWRSFIQQLLGHAQRVLDAQSEKAAREAVNNLFTTDAHTALEETTQATIDAAKTLVDALPVGEVKTQLTTEIKQAQELLDKKNSEAAAEKAAREVAREAVNNLFTTDAHTALKETTAQAIVDAAKKLVDALPTDEVKTQLTVEIKKAQELLDNKNQEANDSKIDVDDYVIGSSRYVKGKILGKKIKKVTLEINGELKKSINASTGPFQYWTAGQIISEKDQVFVVGLDAYGNKVRRTKVSLTPSSVSEKTNVSVSTFIIGKDNYITGTYEGNVKAVALRIDGVLTQKIAVKDGVIKYYAKGKIKDSSSKVELVAIDALGKEIATQTVKVSDTVASVKVDFYKLGESYIQGTYTGEAKYMAIEVNGRILQTIGIANGVLKYYAKGKINFVDDKVNIILLDGNKTEIKRTPLKMLGASGRLAFINYKLNAPYITGTYIGDIVKVRVSVNGTVQRVIPVSNSKFQYYARNLITKKYDYVKIEGLDSSNNVLDMKIVIITK